VLHWGGQIHDGIPLPFAPLAKVLPFLRMSGAPARWHFLALLGTSVLAGWGLSALLTRVGQRRWWRVPAGHALFITAGALLLAELAPNWIDGRPVVVPAFAEELADQPSDDLVYDIGDDNEALLRQTRHRHRMIGGYISRPTLAAERFLRSTPLLRAIRGEQVLPCETLRTEAEKLKLRFVIAPADQGPRLSGLGLEPRGADAGMALFEIPWSRP
jgi:hypothetical protein